MKNIWNYSQPNFYKFSEDSIELTKYLVEKSPKKFSTTLDLCSGCGVLGIELISHEIITSCDFLELQPEFLNHILENIKNLETFALNYSIYIGAIGDFLKGQPDKFFKKYELIIANPPFFNIEDGRLSPSNQGRNQCRFFLKDNYQIFFNFITRALKNDGVCYFITRELETSLFKNNNYAIEKVKEVKGSSIFKLTTRETF